MAKTPSPRPYPRAGWFDTPEIARANLDDNEKEALLWLVRRRDGINGHGMEDFERWREASPAHNQALAKVKRLWPDVKLLPPT